VCRSKHVEQLRNIGIINSTTRSHLVCYFNKIYVGILVTLDDCVVEASVWNPGAATFIRDMFLVPLPT
jgi:hypothetical protein